MQETVNLNTHQLELTQEIKAKPETVFRAWTEKDLFQQWMAPTEEMKTVIRDLDLRAGGKLTVEMTHPDGDVFIMSGVYRDVVVNKKLEFSWRWTHDAPDSEETFVCVEFEPKGEGTLLRLTHSKFSTEESRDKHGQGWAGCLARLTSFVQK
ncbi:MAG: SRPBCC domain-containing protein [Fimbriimonadaceae bacterium]|nr:SRPBCC domain-containing protein [Fimbriimonadaceae bacterium]